MVVHAEAEATPRVLCTPWRAPYAPPCMHARGEALDNRFRIPLRKRQRKHAEAARK